MAAKVSHRLEFQPATTMSIPLRPTDQGIPVATPTISREKERLFAPARDTVPAPGAGPLFGRRFFRQLRENTGGYFLLLFTGIGVGLFLMGLTNTLGQDAMESDTSLLSRAVPMLIGSIFILGSLQMLVSLLAPEINRERVGPAAEPWTWDHPWRKEWMARDYASGSNSILGRLVVIPVTGLATTAALSEPSCVFTAVASGFGAVSVLVVYDALRRLIQWLRFRHPVVIWSSIPTFQGETLAGRIAYARPVRATAPPRVTLRCVREDWLEPVGPKQSRSLQPFAVYRETHEVPLPGKDALEWIDFAFEVPYDQPGTDLAAEKPTYWQVVVYVPLAGPDLETVFLAPVYQHKPRK